MSSSIQSVFTYLIASVWLVNGLFAKVLNLVPRHQLIVETIFQGILSLEIIFYLTKVIGFSEIVLAFLVISGYKSRSVTILQIILVMTMNVIEFVLVDDLLLFGKWNLVFASLFCIFIYWNEFILKNEPKAI